MEKPKNRWTLGELATLFDGEIRGPADKPIARPAPAQSSDPEGLAFATSEAYVRAAIESGVGALLVPREAPDLPIAAIAVDDPRTTFGRFLAMCVRPLPIEPGVHPTAIVSPEAYVDPTANVGAYAVVERAARIGPNARIYPFAYVGEDCTLGADVVIYPHAVLYQSVKIGDRGIVHAGAVLGADGFGYVWDGTKRAKVPQVGGVSLAEDTEIGALTSVDRATSGDTTIGRGTKLDNHIQIGHNCSIGEHTVMASFVGISGSSSVGDRCVFAGQVGTSDHIRIGDDVTLGGRSGVTKDLPGPGTFWGTPAVPVGDAMRVTALSRKLPDLFDRLKELEKRVKELEKPE